MKLLINPGWVMGLLTLLVSPSINAQVQIFADTASVYIPFVPDTIYYSYQNGVQMIEVDHMKLWETHEQIYRMQFTQRNLSLAYPVLPPISNEYFFRNKQGEIIQTFNSPLSLDSLQKLNFKASGKRASHIRKPGQVINRINFGGYYKVFNVQDLQVQRKKISKFAMLMVMQMHYLNPLYCPKFQCDTTTEYMDEYPYRFTIYSLTSNKARDGFKVYSRKGSGHYNHITNPTQVRFGLIDSIGKETVPIDYRQLIPWYGSVLANREGKWGMIDKNNQVLLPLIYDEIKWRSEGFVIFRQNKKDILGSYLGHIIPIKSYEKVIEYYPYLIVVKNKKKGLLNLQNQLVQWGLSS